MFAVNSDSMILVLAVTGSNYDFRAFYWQTITSCYSMFWFIFCSRISETQAA